MNRDELLARLSMLYAEAILSDSSDEFTQALFQFAAEHAGSPGRMRKLIDMLATAWPETYGEVTKGTTLPSRMRKQAFMLGKYLADAESGISQFEWATKHQVEPKTLQRALKRYHDDPKFRADCDSKASRWREAAEKRHSGVKVS